jgi:xanthine dehydrogenase accessory factor
MNGLPALISAIKQARSKHEPVVMATIIETRGSTYRNRGARMILQRNGGLTGLLGGGCFEGDLATRAKPVFENGRPTTVTYDMQSSDDAIWGLGLGCNGAVTIFLQRLDPDNHYQPLGLLEDLSRQGGQLHMVIESSQDPLPAGHCWSDRELPDFLASAPPMAPGLSHLDLDDSQLALFVADISPPIHLLICGGGPDAWPLANMAKTLGWQVSVADHRPAYASDKHFSQVDHVILFEDELDTQTLTAAIVMSHNLHVDHRYLQCLATAPLRYIGMLGPTARRQQLLDEMGEQAGDLAGRLHGPVGLDLGGELPEEIALSLLAEIQSVVNQRPAAPLSDPGQKR